MRKHGIVRTVTLTSAMTQILGPTEARVALLFTPPTSAGVTITITTDASALVGQGLNLTNVTGPLHISEEMFGDAVKKAWYAASTGGGVTLGFLETISG